MEKIEIKPSDKVCVRAQCQLRQDYIDHWGKEEATKIVKNKVCEELGAEIGKKVVVKQSSVPGDRNQKLFTAELYVFTPEEIHQFITEIQEKTLAFAGRPRIMHDNGRD